VLRASGVGVDLRKAAPYDAYGEIPFDVPVRATGDGWARFEVRMEEMLQSLRIVRAVLDGLPTGPIFSRKPIKNPKAAKIPAGEIYAAVESPRGELGFYVVSDGKALPLRLKINAPSFCNLQIVPHIAPGLLIAAVVALLGSLDPVLGDVDR
jgi:NADH-quinone oxidoreductase subunit D